ncbi:MAG: DegT/DnrJ/EryC1/StrS family aminotransferase [Dactylosporangium sp.]|nr:DegT/DnrJ/EryC1/StrS family aminotransferase [Dactylosporangium sp.]NNJ60666.1 DegT/DnrJ/EryC1/StrS family aminotransferase [Dactylosporangium sp.]
MSKIPLVDLKASYQRHGPAIDAAMRDVIANTRFIQGQEVADLERAFAGFTGTRFAIGTGSGTAALHLALAALGVGPGDEVAVPAHTFVATAEPVSWLGATPRFVDVDEETGCLDPVSLKAVIDRVRVVLPVHLYGRPADLSAITAIAADAGVRVLEDAAQAHGAELVDLDGTTTRAGAYGAAGCFSFYPGKNLGAFGDAGIVTTDDAELADRIRMLRDHGRTTKYEHTTVGYAHRLDTLQAAVLGVKLTTLDADNVRRRDLAARYTDALWGLGDLLVPSGPSGLRSVFHLYVVRTRHRDALLRHLHASEVGAGVHYPIPLHLQPAFASLGYHRGDLPVTEAWADECLSLPLYPELTWQQQDRVVAAVRAYFDGVS